MRIEDLKFLNGYKPLPWQMRAHRAKERTILVGGSMGPGKTTFIVNSLIWRAIKYPGSRQLLCRQYLSSMWKTCLQSLEDWLPARSFKRLNKNESYYEFVNGSRIYYAPLASETKSDQKILGGEFITVAIDEASEIEERSFHLLNTRLRQKIKGFRGNYKRLLSSNPTGNWIRARFLEKKLPDHVFISASPEENPHLPSDYVEQLKKDLPEELVEAWIRGDWYAVAGENNIFTYKEWEEATEREQSLGGVSVGVDMSRYGNDETVICVKAGNTISFPAIFIKKDVPETANRIMKIVKDRSIPIFIDAVGIGAGVADLLRKNRFNVKEVVGSERARESRRYKNIKTEAYFNLKDQLSELSLPQDEKLKEQMLGIKYKILHDERIAVETRGEMQKRGLSSPDRLDACVLACLEETEIGEENLTEAQKMYRYFKEEEEKEFWEDVKAGRIKPAQPGHWTGARYLRWNDLSEYAKRYWTEQGYPEKYWRKRGF